MTVFNAQFRVIETLGWSASLGALRLERHLARMAQTCDALGIEFPEAHLRALVCALTSKNDLRVRLTVDRGGQGALEHWPLAPTADHWRVAIADTRLDSLDIWLRHKTTNRMLYDAARAALPSGVDDLIFLNERDEVCEGTITNLFVQMGETLVTPPLGSGLLPGVLRAELLATGRAREAVLTLADLRGADMIFCGNALRGLIPSSFIHDE
jgi:4-amino-4-deoxychorismate lyase